MEVKKLSGNQLDFKTYNSPDALCSKFTYHLLRSRIDYWQTYL